MNNFPYLIIRCSLIIQKSPECKHDNKTSVESVTWKDLSVNSYGGRGGSISMPSKFYTLNLNLLLREGSKNFKQK